MLKQRVITAVLLLAILLWKSLLARE